MIRLAERDDIARLGGKDDMRTIFRVVLHSWRNGGRMDHRLWYLLHETNNKRRINMEEKVADNIGLCGDDGNEQYAIFVERAYVYQYANDPEKIIYAPEALLDYVDYSEL